jgi:hypothetical protein
MLPGIGGETDMSRTVYIHTLNGIPAFFDGQMVVFTGRYGKAPIPAESLRQLRDEQRASARYVLENIPNPMEVEYGYVRYRV